MRDNALAKALHRRRPRGLAAADVPAAPARRGGTSRRDTPIFFGGINVYLQQKLPLFRTRPPGPRPALSTTAGLLRAAAKRSHMTSRRASTARWRWPCWSIEDSPFGQGDRQAARLAEGRGTARGGGVLGNALLAGFIGRAQGALSAAGSIACFQGEDSFLDGLPDPSSRRLLGSDAPTASPKPTCSSRPASSTPT